MVDEDPPKTVDINYVKTSNFREIACDGALGGPTPQGKLWVAFYTERLPLPRIVRHELTPIGVTGELTVDQNVPGTVLEGRVGVIRNVEFGVYLTPSAASQLHEWLGNQLKQVK